MSKCVIGLDFGTLSARALIVDVETGREMGSAVFEYPMGVMDERLPNGTKLPPDWALQDARDYAQALWQTIPDALQAAGAAATDVVGIGIDFTACTMIPLDGAGEPLSARAEFRDEPHAYVKLWKHHAAQRYARRINEIASTRGEDWLARYGGCVSSEWMIPKIWQVLAEAPQVYRAAEKFMEGADYIVYLLTGCEVRSACAAGYKALWSKRDGYPSEDFFAALDERLRGVVAEKLATDVFACGTCAGTLADQAARRLGLPSGIAVAVGNVDAHVSVPAAGLTQAGDMLMIIGTSTCHMMLAEREMPVPGICGMVEDGIIPGLLGYEAGQNCVGDHFGWVISNCVSTGYYHDAAVRGVNLHQLLTEKAARLRPGESGLIALDWFNGNRSVLVDADLSGMLLGMSLTTKPEEIYRALMEATAYGTRKIIGAFEENGVPVRRLFACGGIAQKNAFLMQLYADVTGREIRVVQSTQTPALGSAMFGAVAAGVYKSIEEAVAHMSAPCGKCYVPIAENSAVYDRLYAEYERLHDYFGRGGNDVMKRIKAIRCEQASMPTEFDD